ncbi:MAG: tail completion protein gp17 [Cetobacterium sp.]
MEEEVIALLLNNPGVASRFGDRITYVRTARDGFARPYAVILRVDGVRDYTINAPSGYVASRVQIDVYGDDYTSAKTAARSVIGAINGHKGSDADPFIQGIFIDAERDFGTDDAGEVNPLSRVSIDFIVHHRE